MWRTPEGVRVLSDVEAKLFLAGLSSLVGWLDEDEEWESGVKVFDRLSMPEKLALLEHVAVALLEDQGEPPKQTAVSEGAIAAVYAQLITKVDVELDDPSGGTATCDTVRKAAIAVGLDEFLPTAGGARSAWRDLLELLLDRILWDRDWMEDWVKPDDPPEVAKWVRDFADIDADYYSAVAPDPNPLQLRRIRESLNRLLAI